MRTELDSTAESAETGRYVVPPSGGRASNDSTGVGLPAPHRLKPGLHTLHQAPRHVVPPSGGGVSNNPSRADLSAPHRLKPGLHAWAALSLSAFSAISAVKSLFAFSLFFAVTTAFAQWETQTITVKPGWNAVYLHVDASHVTLDASVGAVASNPITEVWLWNPTMAPDRFINSPQQPVSGNDWASWNRANSPASTLVRLIGNSAYLVKNGGTVDYTWSIQGKPVPPRYEWTSKGVNLIGFATPASSPPFFSTFLGPAQRLASGGEFYRYDDGNNDLTPSLFNALFNTVRVTRGQAYWIRNANEFNRYFGAFEIALQNSSGIHFGAAGSQYSLRVRNTTPGNITLTLALLPSEAAPSGQTAVAGQPPLLRRGDLSTTDLTYSFSTFSPNAQTVTLKPKGQVGSEAEIILGVNRVAMTGNPGDLYAGILRLTDSLGYTQIDLPVSASPASSSGLWVGNALVSQVRHYLKNYQRNTNNQPVLAQVQQSIAGSDTSGLLLEMRLDEGSGTVAKNSAPGTIQRYGSLFNAPVWLPAGNGPPTSSERPTLTFNSTTQQFVELNDGPVLGNPFTQEAWIYSTAQDTALHGFLGFQDASGNRAPSLSIFETNIIRFAYTEAAGAQLSASTARLSLILSNWNHVATTYDGTTLKIYVNGLVQLSDAATFSGKPPKALPVKWVGRAQDSYFQGRIAGVRLWNVVRTQGQIQQSMNRQALTPTLGQYIVTSTNSSLGSVARPFNLRLIVHKSATETRLLQRAYYGLDAATNTVVATRESLLHPALLSSARRISAVHLPFSDGNAGWAFTGQFAQGQALNAQVNLAFGDYASNPFLHGFHPDHDNLNATFDATEPRGVESYDSERKLTLTFTPPGNDFASLVSGGNQMTGQYSEEITLKGRGNESRRIDTAGSFVLKRISDIGTLTTQ